MDFFDPRILSTTTVFDTMLIGLASLFIFWNTKVHNNAFFHTVITGIIFGIYFASDLYPDTLNFFEGPYSALLSINIMRTIACFTVFFDCKVIDVKSTN